MSKIIDGHIFDHKLTQIISIIFFIFANSTIQGQDATFIERKSKWTIKNLPYYDNHRYIMVLH